MDMCMSVMVAFTEKYIYFRESITTGTPLYCGHSISDETEILEFKGEQMNYCKNNLIQPRVVFNQGFLEIFNFANKIAIFMSK